MNEAPMMYTRASANHTQNGLVEHKDTINSKR